MLHRGLENQEIPISHEVRLELHRLLAKAYTLHGQIDKAIQEHEAFLSALQHISGLFDPVAVAIQQLEYSKLLKDVESSRQEKEQRRHLDQTVGVIAVIVVIIVAIMTKMSSVTKESFWVTITMIDHVSN